MKLRFFKNAACVQKSPADPKWKFHVESVCVDCGRSLGWLEQTQGLIDKLNGRLLISNFLEGREPPLKMLEEEQG